MNGFIYKYVFSSKLRRLIEEEIKGTLKSLEYQNYKEVNNTSQDKNIVEEMEKDYFLNNTLFLTICPSTHDPLQYCIHTQYIPSPPTDRGSISPPPFTFLLSFLPSSTHCFVHGVLSCWYYLVKFYFWQVYGFQEDFPYPHACIAPTQPITCSHYSQQLQHLLC